jgi:sulfur-oxidizing protein SoxY
MSDFEFPRPPAQPSAKSCARPSAQRRRVLRQAGALASLGMAVPAVRALAAEPADAFAAKTFAQAVAALGAVPVPSPQVTLTVPQLAEDGAFVPVTVSSTLPGTREIVILVDGNPQPAAVRFSIPAGTEPFVATRIRMAGNGTVYAAVRADDGLFAAARIIEVTVGGCG